MNSLETQKQKRMKIAYAMINCNRRDGSARAQQCPRAIAAPRPPMGLQDSHVQLYVRRRCDLGRWGGRGGVSGGGGTRGATGARGPDHHQRALPTLPQLVAKGLPAAPTEW